MFRSFTRILPLAATLLLAAADQSDAQQSIRPLTLAKLDQFIKGLEAEKAFWGPIWEKDKRTADSLEKARPQFSSDDPYGFNRKQEAYEACEERVKSADPAAAALETKLETDMQKMTPEKMREFANAMGPIAQRAERAQAAGDLAEMNAIIDQMAPIYVKFLGVNQATFTQAMKRGVAATLKQCGKPPAKLTAQERDSAMVAQMQADQPPPLVSDTLTSDVGERVSGLGDNYALMRELVSMFLSAEASGDNSVSPTGDGLTAAERAVIRQRLPKLKALMEFLDNRGALGS